ncbi:hypothetical protein [Actinokineospora sp. HUAS TT18]|uniref:hypothetical protein n=1 Tax=Actinokineospora sp. HUAS TT18 TaxID=3447451 RepID=UPI003F522A1B
MIHLTSNSPAQINTMSFAEYATGGRSRRTEIVTARSATVDFYGPILRALRQAAASDEPAAVLSAAIEATELSGQSRAYTELAEGFQSWWPRRAALTSTGTSTLRVGEVDVTVSPHLALRTSAGEQVVLFHLKEQPLTRDAANAALRVLQICMSDLLPGATPLVVDLRRSQEFRLPRNTNIDRLDAWLTAQAAAFTTHLRESA